MPIGSAGTVAVRRGLSREGSSDPERPTGRRGRVGTFPPRRVVVNHPISGGVDATRRGTLVLLRND